MTYPITHIDEIRALEGGLMIVFFTDGGKIETDGLTFDTEEMTFEAGYIFKVTLPKNTENEKNNME